MSKYRVDFYKEDMMSLIRRDYVVAADVESAREYAVKHTALIPEVDYKYTEVTKSFTPENEYRVIDYSGVYEDEFGCYEVNNVSRTDYTIGISEYDSDYEVMEKLKSIGYLNSEVCITDLVFDWMDDTMVEISEEETMYPICRLELVRS